MEGKVAEDRSFKDRHKEACGGRKHVHPLVKQPTCVCSLGLGIL